MAASVASGDVPPGRRPAGVVRAYAPAGPGRHAVLSWARRHADRTGAPLEILVDPEAARATSRRPSVRDLGARALAAVVGRPTLADRLGRAGAGAGVLVVPQDTPGIDQLVDGAYETVAVVPDQPPHRGGPVVLAVAPRTTDEAVGAAFDAAAARGAPLVALRFRDPEPGVLVTDDELAAETAEERRFWTDHLSGWHLAYPEVALEVHVADGDPAPELVEVSSGARLLVLGRPRRGRLLAAVTPSPVPRVSRAARCPVLVVPSDGPPRRTWRTRP
ncbi:universal stress protein [Actinomycetospora sp. C-140]